MSPAPPGPHPSPEEVDALLDPTGGDPSVARHVRGCAECAEVHAALGEVRVLLREEALRVPPPPADLDARITAALAGAGSSVRAGGHRQHGTGSTTADVVPLAPRRRAAPRWLAVAAGVAVLGGVSLTTGQLLDGGFSGQDAAVTAGSAQEEGALSDAPPPTVLDGEVAAVSTGTDYRERELADQVRVLVALGEGSAQPGLTPATRPGSQDGDGSGDSDGRPGTSSADELGLLTSPAGVAGCLEAIGAGDRAPLAVDLATYHGNPAAVIVLPSDGGGLDAWVVARSCAPGADGLQQFAHVED